MNKNGLRAAVRLSPRAIYALSRGVLGERGQGTLEYAIVGTVIVLIAVVLGALFGALDKGTFAAHITASASHVLSNDPMGAAGDVLFF